MLAGELVGEAMRAAKRSAGQPGSLERVREILENARQELRTLGDDASSSATP